jgi:hypothetical protein
MQKFIVRVGFTRHIVNEFEKDVNTLLDQGFHLVNFSVENKGLFRIFCTAVLSNVENNS